MSPSATTRQRPELITALSTRYQPFLSLEGQQFSKHTAVRAAVHRDLVNTDRWDESLGEDYSMLVALREIADYGGMRSTSGEEARAAIRAAERIIDAVRREHPQLEH